MRALLPAPAEDPDLHGWYARDWLESGGVRVNFVTSLDGAVSTEGLSRGLQTPGDNRIFAVLRDLADVVLVGSGTALAESYSRPNPRGGRLAKRREFGLPDLLPLALVSGTGRGLHRDLPLFAAGDAPPATVFTTERANLDELRDVADVVVTGTEAIDYDVIRTELLGRGLTRMLCEGGPTVFAQAVAARFVDEVCLSLSPLLAGPGSGRITAGLPWPDGPRPFDLVGLLEDDGALFLRLRTR